MTSPCGHSGGGDTIYPTVEEAKVLVADLCSHFYAQGWCSGTGGGISVRAQGGRIVMAPSVRPQGKNTCAGCDRHKQRRARARLRSFDVRVSPPPAPACLGGTPYARACVCACLGGSQGVQKERMRPDDMFVLDTQGAVVQPPTSTGAAAKLSECAPLFMAAYQLRGAGAVIHSHAVEALLATVLPGDGGSSTEFRCTQLEMIKGIKGHGFYDTLELPIVENTARESELTFALRQAMAAFPATYAVLVRRHGVYIWGDTWQQAKTQAECYHYLFNAVVEAAKLGVTLTVAPPACQAKATYSNGAPRWRPGDANGDAKTA
jgi:methylthioribulose-1-phosphate dehydratase